MTKVKEMVNNFVGLFSNSTVKEKVDNVVNNTNIDDDTTYGAVQKRTKGWFKKRFGDKADSRAWNGFTRFICVLLALGFGALIVYMMILVLPKVLMMVAMAIGTMILIELILSILNKAVSPSMKAEKLRLERELAA